MCLVGQIISIQKMLCGSGLRLNDEPGIKLSSVGHCLVLVFGVVSTVSVSLSHWYPGSGVVLDCIDS